ncbi:MAG: glycosyltransferase family 4 protein [Kineosporiaceae bacterium]|nr:glycosyltransferase family 4 protein [Aeromicrobium sp.]
MKILHVTDCYLPQLGGIEMHVSDLAARQQAAGHDVWVLTATPAGPELTQTGDVTVIRLASGTLAFGSAKVIRQLVQEQGFDVMHAHLSVGSPLAWSALRVASTKGRVATMHSVVPTAPALVRSAMALSGISWESVIVTAVSEAAARPLRLAVHGLPVSVLPNGIDPRLWTPIPKVGDDTAFPDHVFGDRVLPGRVFTVVSVGRFTRRKRLRALVRMLAQLRARLPEGLELRALLIGDGPQFEAVRRDIGRCGLDECIELLGVRSRDEIRRLLSGSDVYLAPARLESFGIAALEARCAGLPVIAMGCSGVGEFITDGAEGFLVPDDAAMVDAALELAIVPATRAKISEHNSTTEPAMSWDRILQRHDEIYARAMAVNNPQSVGRGIQSVVG